MKRRPWVVISPPELLKHGLVTMCPITSEPTAARNPSLTAWVVAFDEQQVLGSDIEPGWVLVHHVLTRSTNRIRPEDWTDGRLAAEVMARVGTAVGALAGWKPA